MTELVKIFKPGEPDLKILPEHLDEHKKLGWTVSADQSDEAEEQSEGGSGAGEAGTGKDGAKDGGGPKLMASEAALKFAEENKIDLAKVTGTGKDGAITKVDVQKAIDAAKVTQ